MLFIHTFLCQKRFKVENTPLHIYSSSVRTGEENLHGSKIFVCTSLKGGLFIFLLNAKHFYRYDLNLVYKSYAKNFLWRKKGNLLIIIQLKICTSKNTYKHSFYATNI